MALVKKRFLGMDFASSPNNPSSLQRSNAPASKKLKTTNATFASSPIATAIAAAIEAAGKQPSSVSLRSDASPEAQDVQANSMQRIVCSARRVSDNDASSTDCAAVGDDDDDGIITMPDDSRKNNKTPPIPRHLALPSKSFTRDNSSVVAPTDSHSENPLDILSRVSSRVAYLQSRRAAHRPMLSTSPAYNDEEKPAALSRRAKANIVATANSKETKECYVGSRHPVTRHRHGRGVMTYPNGCRYAGEFVNDMRQGQGKCWYPRGLGVYTGQWYQNEKHGVGTMVYANGNVYDGMWHRDRHNGKGTLLMKGRAEMYAGEFVDNKRHGQGVFLHEDGNVYKGIWANDVQHGEGVLMFFDGTVSRRVYHRGVLVTRGPKVWCASK